MADNPKIEPVLSEEEWEDVRSGERGRTVWRRMTYGIRLWDGVRVQIGGADTDGVLSVAGDELPLVIALSNAALPSDNPCKITWEWVRTLRAEARYVGSGGLQAEYEDEPYRTQGEREARLRAIADALASYLPPREALNGTE